MQKKLRGPLYFLSLLRVYYNLIIIELRFRQINERLDLGAQHVF